MSFTPIANTSEAIASVINGLCYLIINHAQCAATEQWAPHRLADDSDDYINHHSEWVNKLRKIREDFENLTTGFIPRNNEPSPTQQLQEWFKKWQEKEDKWQKLLGNVAIGAPHCPRCGKLIPLGEIAQHPQQCEEITTKPTQNNTSNRIDWVKEAIANDKAVRRSVWPTDDHIWLDKTGKYGLTICHQQANGTITRYTLTPADEIATDWEIYSAPICKTHNIANQLLKVSTETGKTIAWTKEALYNNRTLRRAIWPVNDSICLDKTGEFKLGEYVICYHQQSDGSIRKYAFTPEDELATDWQIIA